MSTTVYQDGFPKSPLEAINYSYFLTDAEKTEWREWVQSATPEQQQELVDTLHEMWQDNQKQVVPTGFEANMQQPAQNTAPQSAPMQAPTPQSVANEFFDNTAPTQPSNISSVSEPIPPMLTPQQMGQSAANNSNSFEEFNPEFDPQHKDTAPLPQLNPSVDNAKQDAAEEQQIKDFGSGPFVSNPILDNTPETQKATATKENSFDNSAQTQKNTKAQDNSKQSSATQKSRFSQKQANNATLKDETKSAPEQKFFKVANVREAATRKALEDIYKQYLSSREKSFASEREYQEFHGMFLDKVMQVVVNFEQVSDYFESMTHKLLEMNDTIVQQAALINDVQTKTSRINNDIELRVDEIERDIDRIYRELKVMKNDYRDFEDDVQGLLAQSGADVYSKDGVLQRIDLISARIQKLEQNVRPASASSLRDQVSSKIAALQDSKPETSNRASQVRRQNQPPTVVGDSNKKTIDLRNKI